MRKLTIGVLGIGLLAFSVTGCSMLPYYNEVKAVAKEGVYTAIDDRKAVNDVKADVLLAVPCDASVGSVMRLEDDRKRAILIELCGGPEADSQVSVEDLAALSRALNP